MLTNAGYCFLSMYKYYSYKDIADIKRGISPPCFYGEVNNKR
jgi:hypothetical protein